MSLHSFLLRLEIGRNIEHDNGRFAVVVRFPGEEKIVRWGFPTHRQAMRKFNELKKYADWLPIQEDETI